MVDAPAAPVKPEWSTPWPHQLEAVEFLEPQGSGMLAMEMGAGKTLAALELLRRWEVRVGVVACPKSVIDVWPKDAEKHFPGLWEVLPLRKGTVAKRAELMIARRAACLKKGKPLLVVFNYEAAIRKPLDVELLRLPWEALVMDESHRLKAPAGKTSHLFAALSRKVPHRLALTGTPMPSSPLDVYAQFRAIDPTLFGNLWTTFRAKYAITKEETFKLANGLNLSVPGGLALTVSDGATRKTKVNRGRVFSLTSPKTVAFPSDSDLFVSIDLKGDVFLTPSHPHRPGALTCIGRARSDGSEVRAVSNDDADYWQTVDSIKGFQHLDELHAIMYRKTYRVLTGDVLDLPEKTERILTFDLPPKARTAYNSMYKNMVIDLRDEELVGGRIDASNALVRTLRLQQVTSGRVFEELDDHADPRKRKKRIIELHDGKQKLLAETLEDLSPFAPGETREPIVVFYRFTHEGDLILETGREAGLTSVELSGRVNDLDLFQDGKADLIAVQIQAGSMGIDLTRARYGIYWSINQSLGDHDQSQKRQHRPGQTRPVMYLYLCAANTSDETMVEALQEKRNPIEAVLDDMRKAKA